VTQDAGLIRDGVLVTRVDASRLGVPKERRLALRRELLERIRAVPGVESAAEANVLPLTGNWWGNRTWMEGTDPAGAQGSVFNRVSPEYFKTMGIALLAGRDFGDQDAPEAPKVAVVNETFARQVAGGANPLGRRFRVEATPGSAEKVYEIVGLVKDSKYKSLRDGFMPSVYLPASQSPEPGEYTQFLVRTKTAPAALAPVLKRAIGEVSPDINIVFRVFKTEVESSLLRERLMATLSASFGLLALVLACIGLYGVMSYGVAVRTNEIGIRLALGAQGHDVLRLILREVALLVAAGVAAGLPAALAAAQLFSSLLYGVTPADPASISLAVLLMLAVAALAGYLPARRATKVDPMVALRYE